LQNVNARISLAFSGFFRRLKQGQTPGYPRFKSKDRYDSFCYPQSGFEIIAGDKVKLSKIGVLKLKLHRPIQGKIKAATIKKEGQKWFVIFSVEKEIQIPKREVEKVVGFDLGVRNFLVLSDGEVVDNPKYLGKKLQTLKKVQSKYSKKKTRNTRRTLVSLHEKIKNQRKDFLHKLSLDLVRKYDRIFVEDLNIQKMLEKNPSWTGLHRNILDCGWANFLEMLQYKAEEAGVGVRKVNPKDTSQRCSDCGEIVRKTLEVRTHSCPNCGLVLDRDLNASRNILGLGLQSLGAKPLEAPAF
jgi:putative transposase